MEVQLLHVLIVEAIRLALVERDASVDKQD
jgi:hypothetical protein